MNKSLNKVHRACSVCGDWRIEILYNLKFKLQEDINLPDNYDIVICTKCGFVYADTEATQDDYDIFYRDHNIYENKTSYSDMHKYKIIFKELQQHWHEGDSILDIGFANGELLKMFSKDGYTELYGLDPSAECVKNILEYDGIRAFQGSLLNHKIDKKFDNIILSHVMEHILDIPKAMEQLYNLLADDGQLYIEVPDLIQYLENSAMPFNYFDIEHINHFNKQSLLRLISTYGFTPIESGEKKWAIGNDMYYPATWVLCRKTYAHESELNYHFVKPYIQTYIEKCLDKTYPEIEELIESQKEIIVWGTGSLAQRLFSMSNLDKCNIKMYIDNNKTKIGTKFDGITISLPSAIKEGYPILILSVYGTEEIKKEIKEMGLTNEIITVKEKVI